MSIRTYSTFNYYPAPTNNSKTLLTGIRGRKVCKCSKSSYTGIPMKYRNTELFISGWYNSPKVNDEVVTIPFVYKGDIAGNGIFHVLNYPSAPGRTVTATNLYGPDIIKCNKIRVVGNYTIEENTTSKSVVIGCLYQGPLDGTGKWITLTPASSDPVYNTIAHSTNGGIVVGNYDTELYQGKAFIYDICSKEYFDIIKPGAVSITAYGVWHNGGNSYTICGGYSDLNLLGLDIGYISRTETSEVMQ